MSQAQKFVVKEERTELTVDHNHEDLVFIYPAFGPGTYAEVHTAIEQADLQRPTLAETASLAYGAFSADNKYATSIKELMKSNWLWGFTGILYTPQGIAYIQDDPDIRDGMPFMDESELVRKLETNDPSVRTVPMGYPIEEMSPRKLASNPLVQALATPEGAEKLAEVASKHKEKPYLWSLDSVSKPTTRVSALRSGWGLGDFRLVVSGRHGGNWDVCALGVQKKTGEASRA